MHMKRTKASRPPEWVNPSGSDQALRRLSPLLRVIYGLIEEGVADALAYFEERQAPIHNVVFATLVRLKLYYGLAARAGASDIQCSVELKGNVGVRAKYQGTTIAIWKADKDGNLPPCGESEQRQLFYTQTILPDVYGIDSLPSKLALLWERNTNGTLTVKLVAPKGYDTFWKSGLIHWEVDVPHPAQAIAATTDITSGAEELDDILKHKKTADEPSDDKG